MADHNADTPSAAITDELIQKLIEAVGGRAGASLVYGDPVDRGDITIIPVAKVGYGFGFGRGNQNESAGGGGGGDGLGATPVGYIEIANGQSRFRPIRRFRPAFAIVPLVLAAGTMAMRACRRK
jgi:uncharacterized spore protein YtfJ